MLNQTSPCEAMNKDGNKCQAHALPGRRHCCFHDPDKATARAAGRAAGGRRRSRPVAALPLETPDAPLGSVGEVAVFLGRAINAVSKGQMDPKVGNCVAVLCGQLVAALRTSDSEARMAAIEKLLAQIPGPRLAR